jgi:uncharacterized membrane protein
MGIINKENIRKALTNPFLFVVLILLIIIALGQSFALWCLIGALIAIPFALFGKDSNSVIQFFCKDSSWKIKSMNSLSTILGDYILWIIGASLIVWALLNFTEKGKEILSLLD